MTFASWFVYIISLHAYGKLRRRNKGSYLVGQCTEAQRAYLDTGKKSWSLNSSPDILALSPSS